MAAERVLWACGIARAVLAGDKAVARSRCGPALCHGVSVLKAPGTIDGDCRGEVGAMLSNHGTAPFAIERGLRIAQLVLAQVTQAEWQETADLDKTDRGAGGFGSTGT